MELVGAFCAEVGMVVWGGGEVEQDGLPWLQDLGPYHPHFYCSVELQKVT